MKRFVTWALRLLLALVIIAALGLGFVYWRSNQLLARRISINEAPLTIPTDAASIAQGKRLTVLRGCTDCHGADLGGGKPLVDSLLVGRVVGPNLTRGKGGLGARLTPTLIEHAVRHGVAEGGRMLLFMPSTDFSGLTDTDTADLIAYVRSLPPVDRQVPGSYPGPLLRTLYLLGKVPLTSATLIDQHAPHTASLQPGATAEYGRYLAQACTGCHGMHFSGGRIPGLPPSFPPAQNITQNPTDGIGKWTKADFLNAIHTGKRPDGTAINPFMPWQAFSKTMTDVELDALWAYLQTIPARPTGRR